MRILAVDTATPCCSVALAENGDVRAAAVDAGGVTHSRHLMGLVESVLTTATWRFDDLDGFAVTRGPGSFTGIRIGMSTVMGLAEAVQRPVVGISALEVLAWPLLQGHERVCALIDARRQEVYCGVYAGREDTLEVLVAEHVAAPQEVIAPISGPCVYVGSGAQVYREQIQALKGADAYFAPRFLQHPDATILAWLAEGRLVSEGGAASDLRPIYLRKSDAQIQQAARAATEVPASGDSSDKIAP